MIRFSLKEKESEVSPAPKRAFSKNENEELQNKAKSPLKLASADKPSENRPL